jgi:hypothetical protein
MIRINLGKEGGPQPAKQSALTKLKLPPQAAKLIKQASEDLGLVAFYVVGTAVALLPQLSSMSTSKLLRLVTPSR